MILLEEKAQQYKWQLKAPHRTRAWMAKERIQILKLLLRLFESLNLYLSLLLLLLEFAPPPGTSVTPFFTRAAHNCHIQSQRPRINYGSAVQAQALDDGLGVLIAMNVHHHTPCCGRGVTPASQLILGPR